MVGAHWPLGCSGLGSLGRLGGLLDHPGAGGCQLCCGAAGVGNTGLVVRMPLARSQRRTAGILCSSTYGTLGAGCLAGGWKGSRVSGRTQPHRLLLSSSRWGHDPMRSPGQAPTTSWSPSSGPGRCLRGASDPLVLARPGQEAQRAPDGSWFTPCNEQPMTAALTARGEVRTRRLML